MIWSGDDELVILRGILDYQTENNSSYNSDWDSFYNYIKDSFKTKFTKNQLVDLISEIKEYFTSTQAFVGNSEGYSFINPQYEEIFQLSKIIWAKKESERTSNEKMGQSYVSEGDGVDEFCNLHEVLEMGTLFQSLDGYQQKLLVQNLNKLGAQERKELTDEWKGLLVEELHLKIKKQSFSNKLADAGLSSGFKNKQIRKT